MSHHIRFVRTFLLVSIGTLVCLSPLDAQAGPRGVFVTIPESFPEVDARAIVLRERGRDVIILRDSEATPEALHWSLFVLRRERGRDPFPENGQMIPLTGFVTTTELASEDRQRLDQLLERLRTRPVSRVGSLGPGRWIRFQM